MKRVLPRMLARGDIFNAGSKEDDTPGDTIGKRARTSFFLSKHSILSSFKRSFRSTGEVSEEAEADENKNNITYEPSRSYGHTTVVEGTNSHDERASDVIRSIKPLQEQWLSRSSARRDLVETPLTLAKTLPRHRTKG